MVIIETSTSGDKNVELVAALVGKALQILAPPRVLVELVEYHQSRSKRRGAPEDQLAVRAVIPVQITFFSFRDIVSGFQHSPCDRGLAGLARPGKKHHLFLQILDDLRFQVSLQHTGNFNNNAKYTPVNSHGNKIAGAMASNGGAASAG